MRPQPEQPRWSVITKQEVVDQAFDNFVGGAADGMLASANLRSGRSVRDTNRMLTGIERCMRREDGASHARLNVYFSGRG
jgi:hypothetical protein